MSRTSGRLGRLILAFAAASGTSALTSSIAEAQDAAMEMGTESATGTEQAAEDDEDKKDPMGWLGIGLKLGVGGVGESSEFEIDNPAYDEDLAMAGVGLAADKKIKIKSPSRAGFQMSVPINMGGDGFGWIFEPYLNFDSDVTAGGMYTGPTFNIHIMDPLYVGFGFGLKGAYWLSAKGADYGADIGGRVPITATYYLFEDIGLVGEFGLGYGGTGFATVPQEVPDPANPGQTKKIDGSFGLGTALMWDFSVGVRWP